MRSAEFDATQRLVARSTREGRPAAHRRLSVPWTATRGFEFGMTGSNKEDAVTVFLSVEPAHPPADIERRSPLIAGCRSRVDRLELTFT